MFGPMRTEIHPLGARAGWRESETDGIVCRIATARLAGKGAMGVPGLGLDQADREMNRAARNDSEGWW
jgi:hypothetical protein